MMRRTRIGFALVIALGLTASSASARYKSRHLEGVVASVNARPILVSEVRQRARTRVTNNAKLPATAKERVAEEQIYKEELELLIEERLMLADADRMRIASSPEEVEAALNLIAQENRVTKEQLYELAREQGMLEPDYRQLLRNQIVVAKWLRVRQKPGATQKELIVELSKTFIVERDLL